MVSGYRTIGGVKLEEAPTFTVLRRLKGFHHESRAFIFWGGCFIPGEVGEIPHGVGFDLFGCPAYVKLSEYVVPFETSKPLQDRYRTWYWAKNLLEPSIWSEVRKEETNALRLRLQASRAKKTSGLIRVARKRAA